jgi:hypothetical protein
VAVGTVLRTAQALQAAATHGAGHGTCGVTRQGKTRHGKVAHEITLGTSAVAVSAAQVSLRWRDGCGNWALSSAAEWAATYVTGIVVAVGYLLLAGPANRRHALVAAAAATDGA